MNFKDYLIEQTTLITEKFSGSNILLYSTSKSEEFEKYFNAQELRFANNAGNMYGLGIYTTLEPPAEAGVGYKEGTRETLYGNNVYEFSLPSDRLVYFLYDYFVKSALYAKCGKPTEDNFVEAQLKYFKIKVDEEDIKRLTPTAERNNAKCAYAFYRFMNAEYYQRDDGTLETPVAGFLYEGKNDGLVGVVWSPYEMKMTRKSLGGKDWQPVKTGKMKSKENNIKDRIFAGNMTDEKVAVYKALQGAKDDESVTGQFVDIVITDDKKVNFTYKSLLPQVDGYRHCLLMQENKYFEKIFKMGYRFGKVDGWLKLGNSSQGVAQQYTPTSCPKAYWPEEISEGFYLTGMEVTDAELKALTKHKSSKNMLAIRRSMIMTDKLNGFEIEKLDECTAPDEIANALNKKYGTEVRLKSDADAEAAAKEAAKRAKEEAKRAKEEEKARKAAEREAKKAAKAKK